MGRGPRRSFESMRAGVGERSTGFVGLVQRSLGRHTEMNCKSVCGKTRDRHMTPR